MGRLDYGENNCYYYDGEWEKNERHGYGKSYCEIDITEHYKGPIEYEG